MARYDRIARIEPPARDDAFTGWLALRDLEDRERDADLGRRARLRFMAVRILHRLARSADGIDGSSLQQQCDAVREELGALPGRDPERQRLADLLRDVPSADLAAVVRGALELGQTVESAGSRWAAEELYRVGLELAESNDLDTGRSLCAAALARLGASATA